MLNKFLSISSLFFANLLYYLLPSRKKIALYNLNKILPELSEKEKKKLF